MNLIRLILCIFTASLAIDRLRSQQLDDDLCGCGRSQTKYRIFNGTVAGEGGFVANVFFSSHIVETEDQKTHRYLLFESICTAVILNSKWLLTARSGRVFNIEIALNSI